MMFTNIYNDVETDYCSVDLITYKAIEPLYTNTSKKNYYHSNELSISKCSITGHHSEHESPAILDKDM